ncbi:putative ABC transporter ATP-binding protein [Actinoplanes missouriensis 431]|uniref:Putative ABC transporter ATP-binding protein n=1 Tax=Actinoplanes missouriensis (strain ATCC 14538 / DSM 43046 / CBS 188.64 / JCM 3121 / NBRC 102363 / NCIMB 12654 / NRRL B-3342 / UNCC 431) TaxID=512565 RepID=I0HHA9_ACTM4|nr:ATP-binding cassette domain-containing protein [Actinoplanes missouriensis]BAL92396.1 putative ABC transporter ATP-binding protein [Actinoplanes missouriensis 431]
MDHPAVEVSGLHVSYGSTPVLVDVGLVLPAGAGICVTGENGIGKSTLLRCVSSLQQPDAGEIRIFGGEPGDTPEFWRAVVTTVEPPTWYPGLTAREHAELICRAHGQDPAGAGLDEAFERFGLAGHADAIPPSLSSGQKQRLTLILALIRPSSLLILDEPEQRLDPDGKAAVAAMLAEYLTTGGSLLMASHDDAFAAASGATVTTMDSL